MLQQELTKIDIEYTILREREKEQDYDAEQVEMFDIQTVNILEELATVHLEYAALKLWSEGKNYEDDDEMYFNELSRESGIKLSYINDLWRSVQRKIIKLVDSELVTRRTRSTLSAC